jgi:hypothetical protein
MASLETSMRSLNHGCLLRPVNSEEIRQATCDIARAVKQLLLVAVPGNNDKITHEG